jgi:hypothetical protein
MVRSSPPDTGSCQTKAFGKVGGALREFTPYEACDKQTIDHMHIRHI